MISHEQNKNFNQFVLFHKLSYVMRLFSIETNNNQKLTLYL